jgi:hypothetical protein
LALAGCARLGVRIDRRGEAMDDQLRSQSADLPVRL